MKRYRGYEGGQPGVDGTPDEPEFYPSETGNLLDADTMPAAWLDVIAERERQIAGESWMPDNATREDLGNCAEFAGGEMNSYIFAKKDRRQCLVKGAAYALAELELHDKVFGE